MTRAEQIKKRLEEIDEEIAMLGPTSDDVLDRLVEQMRDAHLWGARRLELVEERHRLLREYEHLPAHAKGEA